MAFLYQLHFGCTISVNMKFASERSQANSKFTPHLRDLANGDKRSQMRTLPLLCFASIQIVNLTFAMETNKSKVEKVVRLHHVCETRQI